MNQPCDMSELSESSCRTEHMAYLIECLGLDNFTAGLLYKAERLQEKGKLKQAIKYYEKVLWSFPQCHEASENLEQAFQDNPIGDWFHGQFDLHRLCLE